MDEQMNPLSLKEEEKRISEYEKMMSMQDSETESMLGYRHLNSRFMDLEQKELGKSEWETKRKEHKQKKKEIESFWHKKLDTDAASMLDAVESKHSSKEPEYYQSFDLDQLEVLLKSNDRGGNSDEYNSVATDLELFNLVKKKSEVSWDEKERLILNLQKSANYYIEKKNPHFSSGKIRKAMITQIAKKTVEELKIINREQLKADYSKVTQIMNGELVLSDTEREAFDRKMQRLVNRIQNDPVDANQSRCLTTRFFNVIGWTSREPELTDEAGMTEAVSKSAIKHPIFHCINTLKDPTGKLTAPDAVPQGEQLLGKSRHYLSDGIFGKGTYLAYNSGKEGVTDEMASSEAWGYGSDVGSVQVTMCLNEHAKIIDETDLRAKIAELKDKFPKLYSAITMLEQNFKRFGMTSEEQGFSIFAALLGYNVINTHAGVGKKEGEKEFDIRYAVAIDRSALTMLSTVGIRKAKTKGAPTGSAVEFRKLM